MTTPTTTAPALPEGWTFNDDSHSAATDNTDGSVATGDVLTYVMMATAKIIDLTAQLGGGGTTGTGTGPTQADFDKLQLQVTDLVTAQTTATQFNDALRAFATAVLAVDAAPPTVGEMSAATF